MTENFESEEARGLSRRSALKRVGAGAAIVWAAPALLSVSKASAAASPPPPGHCGTLCCPGRDDSCNVEVCFCDQACLNFGDCCPDACALTQATADGFIPTPTKPSRITGTF